MADIRKFPALPGRVSCAAFSNDGKRIAAASKSDGTGEVSVHAYEFDSTLPPAIKAIQKKWSQPALPPKPLSSKIPHQWGQGDRRNVKIPQGGIYARSLSVRMEKVLAAAADGIVRFLNPETGSVVKEFAPVTVKACTTAQNAVVATVLPKQSSRETEALPEWSEPRAPGCSAQGNSPEQPVQLHPAFVTGKLTSGEPLTSRGWLASQPPRPGGGVAVGVVCPKADAGGSLILRLAGKSASVPVTVLGVNTPCASILHDVAPVMSRLGCSGILATFEAGKERLQALLRGTTPSSMSAP